jgi:IS1 family transposase
MVSIMNRLKTAQQVAVVKALVEGNSIRSTVRLTGVAKNTIQKLILELGAACAKYQDDTLRGLSCRRVQCDEIWSFCYAKNKNVTEKIREQHKDAGDVWTWTAIDADSKLVLSVLVGGRDASFAYEFMQDVASRLKYRVQLTTDGWRPYLNAVEDSFGSQIDYATLTKIYGGPSSEEKRYSPAVCIDCIPKVITGEPDPAHISTSYVERHNLTMRMSMRRFTRLTNAFSKKLDNHVAMTSLYFMFYNFGRVHQTLRVTPAMEAKVADHVWSVEEIVALMDEVAKPE